MISVLLLQFETVFIYSLESCKPQDWPFCVPKRFAKNIYNRILFSFSSSVERRKHFMRFSTHQNFKHFFHFLIQQNGVEENRVAIYTLNWYIFEQEIGYYYPKINIDKDCAIWFISVCLFSNFFWAAVVLQFWKTENKKPLHCKLTCSKKRDEIYRLPHSSKNFGSH